MEKSLSLMPGGTWKTTVHQDRDETTSQGNQPRRRHPQPKPSLRLESKCMLKQQPCRGVPQVTGRPPAAGLAATALLRQQQGTPSSQPARPAQQGCLAA